MGVQRNAERVLVVRNSTLWVSAMLGVLVVILIGAAFSSGEKRLYRPAAVMAGFAVLCMSKYTFVFDATQKNGSMADDALRKEESGQHAVRRGQLRSAPE
jgi:hypothetical protein